MAQIRPFAGIRYGKKVGEISNAIAPPYDVLDEKGKSALQAKHPNNIVNVDLPWMPPKSVGPDEAYQKANTTLQAWLHAGVLEQDRRKMFYPYAQSYQWSGRTYHRRGFFALVKLSPFGQGEVVPHEKTYAGPIEDRLKLMRATGMQLSPVFGLFSDPRNEVTSLMMKNVLKPEQHGNLDGVQNDLWTVNDGDIENNVIDLMKHRPVYIADGHHRYTTALHYQQEEITIAGGKLPPAHPANWCMFVLVAMQDDGLLILPTHRMIGGLVGFDINVMKKALGEWWDVIETTQTPQQFEAASEGKSHTFGLYEGATKKLYLLKLRNDDILKVLEPKQSDAWRRLDVAILQRYLLDEIIGPKFAAGKELAKGYTAYAGQVAEQMDGKQFQIALMLNSTPLHALEDLGKHGEVMPQKSTFFYPKLATGLVINPLK